MKKKRIRCSCGESILLPAGEDSGRIRCPACGKVKKVRGGAEREEAAPSLASGAARAHSEQFLNADLEDDARDEEPGPFLDMTAILYPFLYPTCVNWIGLSVVATFAGVMIVLTLICMGMSMGLVTQGVFSSIFLSGGAATISLALTAYLFTTFAGIIQDAARGEIHLLRLPGLEWTEILPPLARTFAAFLATLALSFILTAPWKTMLETRSLVLFWT